MSDPDTAPPRLQHSASSLFDVMARTDEPFSQERSSKAQELLRETFLNEDHIEAFQEALALNDLIPDPTPLSQPESNGTMSPGLERPGPGRRRGSMASIYGWEKVESIKSLSDFAPVHQRISRYVTGGRGESSSEPDGSASKIIS